MPTAEFRKHDDLSDLMAMASDVDTSVPSRFMPGTARDAARALAGLASWVANRTGVIRMQECMATLARHQGAWRRGADLMRDLPVGFDGKVDEYVALIAVVSSSLSHAYTPGALRSGMAFWAVEHDAAAWQKVVEA